MVRLIARFLVLPLLCGCTDNNSAGGALPRRITLSPCHLHARGAATRIPARCGLVRVPENWDAPGERTVSLHVALVEPDGQEPLPDPVVFLAGGPGQSAAESYPAMAGGFARLLRKRSVLLMDQRGTGKSLPLRCAPPPGSETDPFRVIAPDEEGRLIASCANSLKKIADLKQFTTRATVRDLDHVRKQLGFRKLNLYGISYGTRVAQSYLRTYPQNVRSVVLDGVVPQDEALGPRVLVQAPERARKLLVRRCHNDATCKQRFGDLGAAFAAVERRLSEGPVEVKLRHPRSGKPMAFALDWEAWTHTLRFSGYASESLAILPLLVHTAHKANDYAPLAAQALIVADTLQQAIAGGLESSVLCSEDWPFAARDIKNLSKNARYGKRSMGSMARLCALWPHKPAPAAFKKPVVSDKPVLLLSGEVDPVTPPQNATRVAKTLKNSRHLVAPGQGHGVVMRGCMPRLVATFFETADPARVKAHCLKLIKPTPLFVDFAGHRVSK